jgi:hypothetical protein
MAIWGTLVIFFLVIGLVFYILKSIGLQTLAARRGIENPWLAWIPIADLYIMGLLVGKMDIFGYHLDNLGLWLPVIVIGCYILSRIHGIGFLFILALLVFMILFVNKLFGIYTTQATLYTVLSVILGLLPVFLFVIRNNEPLNQAPSGPAVPPPGSDI